MTVCVFTDKDSLTCIYYGSLSLTFFSPLRCFHQFALAESHPACKHCTRLDLQCSYDLVYRWDEEALQNGTTFGRSNQYKKSYLQNKYADFINEKRSSSTAVSTFDYFLKSETSSLIKRLSKQAIPWVDTKNKIYFVNITQQDFDRGRFEGTLTKSSRNIALSPLMDVMKRMLMDDFFLKSLENDEENCSIFTDAGVVDIIRDMDEMDYSAFLQQMTSREMMKPPFVFDELAALGDSSALPRMNIKYSLTNLNLQSNYHYNKLTSLSLEDQKLISYFVDVVCPTCVCYSHIKKLPVTINPIYLTDEFISVRRWESNPYLYLIMPLAFRHEIVMNAIMATSAYQLFLAGNKSFGSISRYYTEKATKQLPDLIREKQCLHATNWDDILATVLMLCFNEISSTTDSISIWMMYLSCAKYFITQVNALDASSPLANFFARYFITHEVIGQTALMENREDSSKGFAANEIAVQVSSSIIDGKGKDEFMKFIFRQGIEGDLYLKTLKAKDTTINVVFGCCPYLICLTHQISQFADCYEGLALETAETRQEFETDISFRRKQIVFEIQHLNQEVQITEDDADESALIIKRIGEIKRLSTLIYLFVRIDLEGLYQDNGVVTKQFLVHKREMEKAKARVIELLDLLPELSVTLLWSIFVLGVATTNYEKERWFVLHKLNKIQTVRESSSLKAAQDTVLRLWKEFDLGLSVLRWKDLINEQRESLSLALIN